MRTKAMDTYRSVKRYFSSRSGNSLTRSSQNASIGELDDAMATRKSSATLSDETSSQYFDELIKSQVLSSEAEKNLQSLNEDIKVKILESMQHEKQRKQLRLKPWKRKKENYKHPGEFITYIVTCPMEQIDETIIHKLSLLLRNEQVSWVEEFIEGGGFAAAYCIIDKIGRLQWREDKHDAILEQFLLCIKAMCTVQLGVDSLLRSCNNVSNLVHFLLSEKQPSDFSVRDTIMHVISSFFKAHQDPRRGALAVFELLRNHEKPSEEHDFMRAAKVDRPYRRWVVELEEVSRDVFWVWNHQENTIDALEPNSEAAEAPIGFIGGIETEATGYLSSHLRLINSMLAALPDDERYQKRVDLQMSGLERIMALRWRKCSFKFHTKLHSALREWVRAAEKDNWNTNFVRTGQM
ncbi:GTPase binding protein Rid1 [Schizosaccharomyces japonicus yFS275]|uniref:GTPase binding protein Rid1 n=1 Tax=Schizosaccharomyces japonicus (strain yFS275 / FY16936) TaxID=402676 RepID=B6K3N9_SCHJY|nr:GTPase binding protein Rid1 [Schizosaccharomyces japonicus yFS275]EEB08096.2 GTPase binding protein Rid1 [Schizosaccharomyces japonicus yFS275]